MAPAIELQRQALLDGVATSRPPKELQQYASQLAQIVDRCGEPCAPARERVRGADALTVLVVGRAGNGAALGWSCLESPDDPTAVFEPGELAGLDRLRGKKLLDVAPRESCSEIASKWRFWYLDTRLPALEGGLNE
jgi:hypothetical protein